MLEEEAIYSDDNDFPDDQDFDERGKPSENHSTFNHAEPSCKRRPPKENSTKENTGHHEIIQELQENYSEDHQIISNKYASLFSNSKKNKKDFKNSIKILSQSKIFPQNTENTADLERNMFFCDMSNKDLLKDQNSHESQKNDSLLKTSLEYKHNFDVIRASSTNLKDNHFNVLQNHKNQLINLESSNDNLFSKNDLLQEPLTNINCNCNFNFNTKRNSGSILKENFNLIKEKNKKSVPSINSNSMKSSQFLEKNKTIQDFSIIKPKKINSNYANTSLKFPNKSKKGIDYLIFSRNDDIHNNKPDIKQCYSFIQLQKSLSNFPTINLSCSPNNNNFHYLNNKKNNTIDNKNSEKINQFNFNRKISWKSETPKLNLRQSLFPRSNRIPIVWKDHSLNSNFNEYPKDSMKSFEKGTNLSQHFNNSDNFFLNYKKQFEDEFKYDSSFSYYEKSNLNLKELKELLEKLHLLDSRLKNETQEKLLNELWKISTDKNIEFVDKKYIHKILKIILNLSPEKKFTKPKIKTNNILQNNNIPVGKTNNFESFQKISDNRIILNDTNRPLIKEFFKEFFYNVLFYLKSLEIEKNQKIEKTVKTCDLTSRLSSNSFKKIHQNDPNLVNKQFFSSTKKKSLGTVQSFSLKVKNYQNNVENKLYYNSPQRKLNQVDPKSSKSTVYNDLLNLNNRDKTSLSLYSHFKYSTNNCSEKKALFNFGYNAIKNPLDLKEFISNSENTIKKKSKIKPTKNKNHQINYIKNGNKINFTLSKGNSKIDSSKNLISMKTNKNVPGLNDYSLKEQSSKNKNKNKTLKNQSFDRIGNKKFDIERPQTSILTDQTKVLDQPEENNNLNNLNTEKLFHENDPSPQTNVIQNNIDNSGKFEKPPILFVDIELENNVKERMAVFEGDTVDELVKRLSESYHLSENKLNEISNLLEKSILQMINTLIKENNQTEVINEEGNSDEED